MSTLQIDNGLLPGSISLPASKSYANRALILASIKPGEFKLHNVPDATDVTQLISALRRIGLMIQHHGTSVTVSNSFPECESEGQEIVTGEGGTTARFLAALLLLGKKPYTLKLGKRLKERPWAEFLTLTRQLGGRANLDEDRLQVQGPLTPTPILEVDCSRTTQFATAFDLILGKTEVKPTNLNSSQSYLLMNEPLKEHFQHHTEYVIPVDWSSAAFPMVFAALNQRIAFPGIQYDPFQADAKLLSVLNDLGAVESIEGGISISPMLRPKPVKLEMSDCLDLFPAMVYLLAHIEGKHILSGIENLKHKESDRLSEMKKLLETFGRTCIVRDTSIEVEGSTRISPPVELALPDDHRIVMAGGLFLRHHSGGKLSPAEAVSKSYPGFFHLMRSPCAS